MFLHVQSSVPACAVLRSCLRTTQTPGRVFGPRFGLLCAFCGARADTMAARQAQNAAHLGYPAQPDMQMQQAQQAQQQQQQQQQQPPARADMSGAEFLRQLQQHQRQRQQLQLLQQLQQQQQQQQTHQAQPQQQSAQHSAAQLLASEHPAACPEACLTDFCHPGWHQNLSPEAHRCRSAACSRDRHLPACTGPSGRCDLRAWS